MKFLTKFFKLKFFNQVFFSWYRNLIRHPKYGIWIAIVSLLYLVNPLDISPDALPIIGLVDDGLIATLLLTEGVQLLRDRLKEQKQNTSLNTDTTPDTSVIDVNAVSLN